MIGPDRNSCNGLKLQSLSLEGIPDDVGEKLLFYREVKDLLMNKWMSVTYPYYNEVNDAEEKATHNSIKFATNYQNDLPKHMLSIFRSVC